MPDISFSKYNTVEEDLLYINVYIIYIYLYRFFVIIYINNILYIIKIKYR